MHTQPAKVTPAHRWVSSDKAVTWDGHEIPLRNVGILAVAAAEATAASSCRRGRWMMGAAGGAGMSCGGDLLGGARGSAGGAVGSGRGRPAAGGRPRAGGGAGQPGRGGVGGGHRRGGPRRRGGGGLGGG